MSVLLHGSELWPVLNATNLKRLNSFMMTVLRRIARCPRIPIPGKHLYSDAEVRRWLDTPAIECILRRRRVGYATSLVCSAAPHVAALEQTATATPSAFAKLLTEDLVYLAAESNKLAVLGHPTTSPATWRDAILGFRQPFMRAVREIVTFESSAAASEDKVWLADPVACGDVDPRGWSQRAGGYVRQSCDDGGRRRVYGDPRGLAMHAALAHGIHGPTWRAIPAGVTQCPHCQKSWPTTAQARNHVRRAPRCQRFIEANW